MAVNTAPNDWAELYKEAVAFQKCRPWEWMDDRHIFGVQNPEDGTIGYCSVLGGLKEVFGLNVYLGAEALKSVLRIRSEKVPPYEGMHLFHCLSVNFDNREELDKHDLDTIRSLDLKFRGKYAWPCFRHYEPGFVPWYFNEKQARFMTVALEQAADVSVLARANPAMLASGKRGYLVRVPQVKNGVVVRWTDEWLEPESRTPQPVRGLFEDELRLRRVGEQAVRKFGSWEVELVRSPFPVDSPDRPYYPLMCMWVDRDTQQIIHVCMLSESDTVSKFVNEFVNLIEQTGGKPKLLLYRDSPTADLFEQTAGQLKIKMEQAASLPSIEEAWMGMYEHMNSRM